MSLVFGLAIFFVVWWIVLFAVLPFGVRTQGEAGEVVPGTSASAPAHIHMSRLLLVNTLVAIVVFCIIWLIIEYDLFGIAAMEGTTPV